MDDILVLIIERYGWIAVIGAFFLYLALEFLLDLAKDLLIDKIKAGRINQGLDEWGSQDDD